MKVYIENKNIRNIVTWDLKTADGLGIFLQGYL